MKTKKNFQTNLARLYFNELLFMILFPYEVSLARQTTRE